MSIINQTLRELDARAAAPAPAAPLRTVAGAARGWPLGWWGGAAVVLALALAMASWRAGLWQSGHTPDAARPAARGVEPAPGAAVIPAAPPAAEPADVAATPERAAAQEPAAQTPAMAPAPRDVAGLALQLAVELPAPDVETPPPSRIEKRINAPSHEEAAEARYRKAMTLLQKGRDDQARPLLEEALGLHPAHTPARQALVALLIEAGQAAEAEAVLRTGRAAVPGNAWFALGLARLQAARGEARQAITTLREGLDSQGVDADYHATLAALLVQAERPAEALPHYRQALAEKPGEGVWWAGLGLALAAEGKTGEARSAFERALMTGRLPEKLAAFLRAKLAE
jgi:MSHA biogenesis protein MshN